MGLLDSLTSFASAVNREYDRRIKAASLVKEYDPTGAAHHHHGAHSAHDTQVERIEGEGGAVGRQQANAGPHLQNSAVADEVVHR